MKPTSILCLFLVLGGSAAVLQAAEKPKDRFSGAHSGVKKAGERVVTDAETWKSVWKQVHRTRSPQPNPPEIDFEKQAVLAVFLGEKFTGGYGIRITGVKDAGEQIVVTVKKTSPGPGAITTQALTQPYDMLVVEKPTKPVKFVVQGGGKGKPKFPFPRRPKPPGLR